MNIEYTLEITKVEQPNAQSFYSLKLENESGALVAFIENTRWLSVLAPNSQAPVIKFVEQACLDNARAYVEWQLAQKPRVTCTGYGAVISNYEIEQAHSGPRRIANPLYDQWLFARFLHDGKGEVITQATHKITVEAYVKATLDGNPFVLI